MEETKRGKSATEKQNTDEDITYLKSMMTHRMAKYNMKDLTQTELEKTRSITEKQEESKVLRGEKTSSDDEHDYDESPEDAVFKETLKRSHK